MGSSKPTTHAHLSWTFIILATWVSFLGKPAVSRTPVDTTHFQGNAFVLVSFVIFKKPVCVLLNPADHAQIPVLMGQSQRDRLGAVLRDAVAIV
jgi:hypothetical protein